MGGEETTYVEKAWKIVGLNAVTPRKKGTGLSGVPDAAGIARTFEALAVDENRGRVGNQRGGGGGRIPRTAFLRSGRVCVWLMKRSQVFDYRKEEGLFFLLPSCPFLPAPLQYCLLLISSPLTISSLQP